MTGLRSPLCARRWANSVSRGEYAAARGLFQESLESYRELGEPRGVAWSLENLGHVALKEGDLRAAGSLYAEGLRLRRDLEDLKGVADCLAGLTALAAARNQPTRAALLFGAVVALRKRTDIADETGLFAEVLREMVSVRQGLREEAFSAARAEGGMMSLEKVLASVLEAGAASTGETPSKSSLGAAGPQ